MGRTLATDPPRRAAMAAAVEANVPFAIVVVLAVAMAVVAQHLFPDARALADAVHALRGRLG